MNAPTAEAEAEATTAGQEVPAPGAETPQSEDPRGDAELEGEGEEERPAIPELEIEGVGQLSLKVGGEKPDESLVKLRGGSVAVAGGGQFDKGQVIDLVVKAQVSEVHFVDKRDKQTGEITGVVRRHILKPVGVEKV